jgi:tRNA(Arg) A34 adenosine deaminase TadA
MLIKRKEISVFGLDELDNLEIDIKEKAHIKQTLAAYKFHSNYLDDDYCWLTCVLALEAACKGNFGIGALLVDSNGNIVESGHNEVFNPYFRSDRHAEMVVLTRFEEKFKKIGKTGAFCLYTSLEPCPMCLARLITSGIGFVKYISPDPTGGMLHMANNLPKVWIELLSQREYKIANCSKSLEKMATEIFSTNMEYLNNRLGYRSSL